MIAETASVSVRGPSSKSASVVQPARLALAHGVPLIPIRLVATRQLVPRRPIRVLVGNAIEVRQQKPTIATARALTARVEAAVEALA